MGHHFVRGKFVDWKKIEEEAQKLLNFLEVDIELTLEFET